MAKDVSNKQAVSSSSSGDTSPSSSDHQKVPPLRIVLNTSGNQKSPSTGIAVAANQQQELKRERSQNAKNDNILKGTGGRVRIKLGTNKQNHKSSSGSESSAKAITGETQKQKSIEERKDNLSKEDFITNYSHLRRITRRSQKTAQTVNTEDEESISSMTSTDENQNTSNNNNSDNASDTAATTISQSNCSSNATTVTITNNTINNSDTPRRYKRRKGETSESSLNEQFNFFGFQNYKLPTQNSFELYKNIRKQVDKKLNNLSSIHLASPRGFRDYMLSRGTYLLEGNRLGNGTNLFMNEDGGLYSAPLSKYHALRSNRVSYFVPNRAKVPLGLPVNSPLYNLFIDQEKERYRMRIQHIKEREKLTLAAEQEILRVYNQAAMVAANQNEPFSACTMLKHQEIYNYMDADGTLVLASGDLHQDEIKQEEGSNHHRSSEQTPLSPVRRNSNVEEVSVQPEASKDSGKASNASISKDVPEVDKSASKDEHDKRKMKEDFSDCSDTITVKSSKSNEEKIKICSAEQLVEATNESLNCKESTGVKASKNTKNESSDEFKSVNNPSKGSDVKDLDEGNLKNEIPPEVQKRVEITEKSMLPEGEESRLSVRKDDQELSKRQNNEKSNVEDEQGQEKAVEHKDAQNSHLGDEENSGSGEGCCPLVAMEQVEENETNSSIGSGENALSDDVRQANDKELFLTQLRDIDDKWDRIRSEMLIRHKNEAESLHAVQKLEWEWKTKEIGACDIRMTPVIDNVLVPKLSIYSQDY